ncbi:MAG: MBL fold metallo-hydrolase [Syntrophorhabdaceae bacterium]|nr:MBL fold metallo-hydrolase [Syntrophorhabdaceae bacterium]
MNFIDNIYVIPWVSYEANNCNTVFIDGPVPTLIDPGHKNFLGNVVNGMAKDGKRIESVKLVIGTHSHPDHIEAADAFDKETMRAIGKAEFDYLNNSGKELYLMTGCEIPKKPYSFYLNEGTLDIGDTRFQVLLTPGHSPGSLCLYCEEKKLLISGDTVFYMGVGRTDLPGGNMEALAHSITRLASLDIEYLIPGHGEAVRGKDMIQKNFTMIMGEFF